MKLRILLTSVLFSSLLSVNAESFRVAKTIPADLSSPSSSITVKSGIGDAVSVTLPKDLTYVTGLEFKIKIPDVIAGYRNSVAYSFYHRVTPSPSEKIVDYKGEQFYFDSLPGALSQTVYVPLTDASPLKDNPYTKIIRSVPDITDGKIMLRFQLVMKGVSEDLYSSQFEITVRPILLDKGRVKISVTVPPELRDKPYSIYIDDKLSSQTPKELFSTGEHHLSIVSDAFRNEVRTFRIEQAKTSTVSVTLRDIAPSVKFVCPETARILFDQKPVANPKEELTVTPGEHSVKFIIGDYEIIRTVFAENGRSYSINLNIDAQITESE